jgi:hypothetical protein
VTVLLDFYLIPYEIGSINAGPALLYQIKFKCIRYFRKLNLLITQYPQQAAILSAHLFTEIGSQSLAKFTFPLCISPISLRVERMDGLYTWFSLSSRVLFCSNVPSRRLRYYITPPWCLGIINLTGKRCQTAKSQVKWTGFQVLCIKYHEGSWS